MSLRRFHHHGLGIYTFNKFKSIDFLIELTVLGYYRYIKSSRMLDFLYSFFLVLEQFGNLNLFAIGFD